MGPGPSGSRFGVQKGDHPALTGGGLQLLFYKVFAKTHGWGSRGTLDPLYAHHGWGVPVWYPPKNLPGLKDHLHAKFQFNLSRSSDFYREHPDTQTFALYILVWPGRPGVARNDSKEVLKRVLKCKFSMVTQVNWDRQILAFQGPASPSRPMPCPCGQTLLKGPI